jgi:hypothetical protein
MEKDEPITKFLSLYNANVYNLAINLRNYLHKNLPNIREQLDIKARIVAFGYGPGYKDNICSIILSKTGIKLGINRGAELPDPLKLLTGSGKVHKYMVINSENDIKSAGLRDLLKEALKSYKKRNISG